MSTGAILRLGSLKDVGGFQAHVQALDLQIPCDPQIVTGAQSPLRWPLKRGPFKIGNRIAVQPMEGWDATPDGAPSENTVRRWQRFGRSGGKLIWGGEAVAVSHEGRANPNQLLASPRTQEGLAHLRTVLRRRAYSDNRYRRWVDSRFAIDALRPVLPPERTYPPRTTHSLSPSIVGPAPETAPRLSSAHRRRNRVDHRRLPSGGVHGLAVGF